MGLFDLVFDLTKDVVKIANTDPTVEALLLDKPSQE